MDEDKKYPHLKEFRFIEMTLIKALQDKRCWSDYVQIHKSLVNISLYSEGMKKEADLFSDDLSEDSNGR